MYPTKLFLAICKKPGVHAYACRSNRQFNHTRKCRDYDCASNPTHIVGVVAITVAAVGAAVVLLCVHAAAGESVQRCLLMATTVVMVVQEAKHSAFKC